MLNLNTKNENPLNNNNNNAQFEHKNENPLNNNNNNNSILAFKPRQVILSAHHHHNLNLKPTTTMNLVSNEPKVTMLAPEIKGNLDALILDYLNRNGFNKTLKRFQSEARIQTDTRKASSLHLEDIFCKYNACNDDGNKNTSKKPVFGQDKPIDYDNIYATNEEPTTKKKKKKGATESENGAIIDQSEIIDTKMVESDTKRVEPEIKPKKKKETKHDLGSSSQAEVKIDMINGLKVDDSTKKTKEKKKESMQQDKLMPSTTNDNELATDHGEKERKKKKKKSTTDGAVKDEEADVVKMDSRSENMSSKEKKSSKKRKRSSYDENENLSTEVRISEESKCQKTQTFEEEKSKKEEINPQETSNKQLDEQTNGGEKSDAKKSTKKQRNVTAEPKTVNAFQRVKIDQVEFADEKLQDNSYRAKDGADIGYGAKAQEVLGQVRGRDFRHEKTKKKRGSYRGGPIDLQSHSIKFNYSDE